MYNVQSTVVDGSSDDKVPQASANRANVLNLTVSNVVNSHEASIGVHESSLNKNSRKGDSCAVFEEPAKIEGGSDCRGKDIIRSHVFPVSVRNCNVIDPEKYKYYSFSVFLVVNFVFLVLNLALLIPILLSETSAAPFLATGAVALALTVTFVVATFCFIHRDNPMVIARGRKDYLPHHFISMIALVTVLYLNTLASDDLYSLGHFRAESAILYIASFANGFGSIVARQRIIYLIFYRWTSVSIPRGIYTKTVLCLQLLWILCIVPIITTFYLANDRFIDAVTYSILIIECIVLVLMSYYTYLCREVTSKYSDWRQNARAIALTFCVVVVVYLSAHIIERHNDDAYWSPYVKMFGMCFVVEVILTDQFFMMFLVVHFALTLE
eukprot:CFRG0234T1